MLAGTRVKSFPASMAFRASQARRHARRGQAVEFVFHWPGNIDFEKDALVQAVCSGKPVCRLVAHRSTSMAALQMAVLQHCKVPVEQREVLLKQNSWGLDRPLASTSPGEVVMLEVSIPALNLSGRTEFHCDASADLREDNSCADSQVSQGFHSLSGFDAAAAVRGSSLKDSCSSAWSERDMKFSRGGCLGEAQHHNEYNGYSNNQLRDLHAKAEWNAAMLERMVLEQQQVIEQQRAMAQSLAAGFYSTQQQMGNFITTITSLQSELAELKRTVANNSSAGTLARSTNGDHHIANDTDLHRRQLLEISPAQSPNWLPLQPTPHPTLQNLSGCASEDFLQRFADDFKCSSDPEEETYAWDPDDATQGGNQPWI